MILVQYLLQALSFTAIAISIWCFIFYYLHQNQSLPPGPYGLPFFGYYPFISITHTDFSNLREIYGDVFSFRTVGGRLIVVLNGAKLIKDVLVNRAEEFVGRPHGNNMVHWMSDGLGITQEEGEPWNEQRRFFLQTAKNFGFGKSELEERIQNEIRQVIEEIRKPGPKSEDVGFHLAHAVNSVISHVLFSKSVPKDQTFRKILGGMKQLVGMFIGNKHMLVGYPFKLMTWIPQNWKFEKGRVGLKNYTDKIVDEQIRTHDPENLRGYVDVFLKQRNDQMRKGDVGSFSKERLQANTMNLFFEGTESVGSTTLSLLLKLSKYPDVQETIQMELDNVVGRERMPSWADRAKLPYLDAAIQELYRTASIFLVTTMYSNFKATVIDGCRIPRRSVIVANLYSINMDPEIFPEPELFEPKRFLNEEGKRIKKEGPYPFGIGKRSCIGESLAHMEVFLIIGCFLQCFSIPPADEVKDLKFIERD